MHNKYIYFTKMSKLTLAGWMGERAGGWAGARRVGGRVGGKVGGQQFHHQSD